MDFLGLKEQINWNCTLFAKQQELKSCLVAVEGLML